MRSPIRVHILAPLLVLIGALASGALLRAQFRNGNQTIGLELPRMSPRAVVTQRVGLTDITVIYHRPQANGRQVFGDIVGFDRVWRAGANDNTTIEFAHPVKVEGADLAAGRYGVHIIPRKNEWVVVFSKNSTSWGSFSYDPAEDALRVRVTPVAAPMREALSYEFTDLAAETATLVIGWEKLAAPVKLWVDSKNITLASLRNQLRHLAGFNGEHWYEAALYCVDNDFNYPEALTWIDHAIGDNGGQFDSLDLKSQILARLGRTDEAAALQTKALAVATPDQRFMYGTRLLRDKKTEEAERLFVEITTKHPESWRGWYGLAQVQVAKGDRKAAEKSLTEAVNRAQAPGEKAGLNRMLERLAAGQSIGG